MTSYKDDRTYLFHMLEEMKPLLQYVEEAPLDHKTIRAICRCYEIIGEAANKLSEEFRKKYAEYPWRGMIDMRNHIIHAYDSINTSVLVDTARNHVAPIYPQLLALFTKLDQEA